MKKTLHAWGWLAAILFIITTSDTRAVGYTLTVVAQGPGVVARNPSNASYPAGVVVTITATPNTNSTFTGWSGDTNGTVNPLNVTMNSSLVITGNFLAFSTYPLTLTTNGQGTISLNPTGSIFVSNTVVTATATPTTGWIFTGWTGSAAGGTNPLSFMMNSSNSLAGNFTLIPVPPAFDVQPQTTTNAIGGTASFFAHATNATPLNYQWFQNNLPLAGATNTTLVLTNVALANAGAYKVVVTNFSGGATSSVATLLITNASVSTNLITVCDEPSLRAAIVLGGWISIGCNGTITLSNTIAISNNVILDGTYVAATISGNNTVRLFTVTNGASLTVTNIILADGQTSAGYPGNTPAEGGAINNNGGTVRLVNCTLRNNVAISQLGSGPLGIYGNYGRGGAIYNNAGMVNLQACSVFNNQASGGSSGFMDYGQGGAIYNTNGNLTAIGCNFKGNLSIASISQSIGGGIFQASGSSYFSNCTFVSNSASGSGSYGSSGISGIGAGIAAVSGNVSILQCQFSGNNATGGSTSGWHGNATGGAIYNVATMTISDSRFFNNSAVIGASKRIQNGIAGAVFNGGSLVMNASCIYSNFVQGSSGTFSQIGTTGAGSSRGAGIYNSGQFKATNCTIAGNIALAGFGYSSSGQAYLPNGNATGGGIYNNGFTTLMNVTLANNYCDATGNGTNGFSAGDQIENRGSVSLHNSLLAYAGPNGNVYGGVTDDGHNISSDGTAGLFASGTSYNFTDPKLLALADNGGATLTMALASNSPAIDNGDSSGAPNSDQRGLLRPFGDGMDIGAFEYGAIYPSPSPMNFNLTASAPNLFLNFTASPPFTYHLQSSTNLTSWSDVETIGAFSSPSNITRTISPAGIARKFFRVWYQ